MMQTNHQNYSYCSTCLEFRYTNCNLNPTIQPPVLTPRSMALAASLIDAKNIEIDRWNEYPTRRTAIVRDPYCSPASIRVINSSELLFDFLDNLCEMMTEPPKEPQIFTSSMNNARSACLVETKRLLYGKLSMKIQIDPFERGNRLEIFEKIDSRFRSVIGMMSEYVDDFYYCFECECFGERKLLLGDMIKHGEKCGECR